MRIIFIGDIVGEPGIAMLTRSLPGLREAYRPDVILVNGENAASDGRGITPDIVRQLMQLGISLITSGNHIWAKKEIVDYLAGGSKDLLRPANFPGDCPGSGVGIVTLADGRKLGVINLMGRVFMHDQLDCPFRAASSALTYLRSVTPYIFVDMHAETTAEKRALATYLDGKVSAVVGTHTHVQTADERILPGGTAYMTDVGMGGALNSSLGMKVEPIIKRFLSQMPVRFMVEQAEPWILSAVFIELESSGKAVKIERICVK
jgi:metallophosphoesterase (TIGR00282 family)